MIYFVVILLLILLLPIAFFAGYLYFAFGYRLPLTGLLVARAVSNAIAPTSASLSPPTLESLAERYLDEREATAAKEQRIQETLAQIVNKPKAQKRPPKTSKAKR